MEQKFNRYSSILDFGPKAHLNELDNYRKYLFWPAWAYRVIAPAIRQRDINIFEKAVLGICKIGAMKLEDISDKLYLPTELCEYIVGKLQLQGYLHKDLKITKKGLHTLSHEIFESETMVTGYVFQDTKTRKLWPRFVEKMSYADIDYDNKGFPVLVRGSTGKHKLESAYLCMPEKEIEMCNPPMPKEILRTIEFHLGDLKRLEKGPELFQNNEFSSNEGSEDDEFEMDLLVEQFEDPSLVENRQDRNLPLIKQISLIEDNAIPVFLTTYLYPSEHQNDWYVCDPFGIGYSLRFRELIIGQMGKDRFLRQSIDKWKNSQVGHIKQKAREDLRGIKGLADDEARKVIENRFPKGVGCEIIGNRLFEMEASWQHLELDDNPSPVDLQKVVAYCERVLVRYFLEVSKDFSVRNVWKPLFEREGDIWKPSTNRDYCSNLLEEVARSIGFECPLPKSLKYVQPGKIRSAAQYNSKTFRPVILCALLAARTNPDHPLRKVATVAPDMLHRLDEIAELRDPASHENDIKWAKETVNNQRELVFELLEILLRVWHQ